MANRNTATKEVIRPVGGEQLVRIGYKARAYQGPLWRYMRGGGKRAVCVWHRRAGKDTNALHLTRELAMGRVGTYWHMLPSLRQGRRVIWEGIDRDGFRIIDKVWPQEIREATNNTEMRIQLINGSQWYVLGSDNYDAAVGSNPVGVVMSEYSIADPAAWDYIRPILAENGGWAIFIYTPRGKNHGYTLYQMARKNPDWFAELLTVDDTNAIPQQAVTEEREAGMSEDMVRQEFYCSFEASLTGAYYGEQMGRAFDEGRITSVPHDPGLPVETWWDLGVGDQTSIWFAQRTPGGEIRLIDYYENSGEGLPHYVQLLNEKAKPPKEGGRGFAYGTHAFPHDIEVRELSTGESRRKTLDKLGVKPTVVPRASLEDGIEVVRRTLERCWFDEDHCGRGIECLRSYRKRWNEIMQTWGDELHDWASHGADAFRYGCSLKVGKRGRKEIDYPKDHISNRIV